MDIFESITSSMAVKNILPLFFPKWSVQFSCSVMSDSLRPHEPQHVRPPCPSPTPSIYPNSCLLSQWYHPTISSSAVPFSSRPQSFPASGFFQMSQLFPSGGQSIKRSLKQVTKCPTLMPMAVIETEIQACTFYSKLKFLHNNHSCLKRKQRYIFTTQLRQTVCFRLCRLSTDVVRWLDRSHIQVVWP